jgi:acyl-CoA thioester hydrolase
VFVREGMDKVELEVRVRYVETDQMGVAHHASYFAWMEAARTELLRLKGLPYKELEARGYFLPVREAFCRYRRSLQYDNIAVVEVKLLELKGASLKLGYRIYEKNDRKIAAEGYTMHPFVDKNGKIVKVPGFFKKLFGE